MSIWDWVTVIGLCVAAVEVLVLVGMFAWWFADTLSYIRSVDRQIAERRRQMLEERIRAAERRARWRS